MEPSEQKNQEEEHYKLMMLMLTRATQIAMSATFLASEMLVKLDELGVLNKKEVVAGAQRASDKVMSVIVSEAENLESQLSEVMSKLRDDSGESL